MRLATIAKLFEDQLKDIQSAAQSAGGQSRTYASRFATRI